MSRKTVAIFALLSLVTFTMTACNWDGPPPLTPANNNSPGQNNPPPGNNNPGTGTGKIDLIPYSQPTFSYGDPFTTVAVQFIVRDGNGVPMAENKYDTTIIIDGETFDRGSEGILDHSSEALAVNLYLTMVLDASSSMLAHTPEAFSRMISAAKDTYQEARNIWSTREGDIKFSVIWFNTLLHQSFNNENHTWSPNDLSLIPAPATEGAFTKLHSSISTMSSFLLSEYNKGVFNNPRDQHVMLVFTDGKDTFSHVGNAITFPETPRSLSNGANYYEFGTAKMSDNRNEQIDSTIAQIKKHPQLTAHVIGLGSDIDKVGLEKIAKAGNGIYLENPRSDNIDALFSRVLSEFALLQTQGVKYPFLAGKHSFKLRVTDKTTNQSDEYNFNFESGPNAKVVN